MSTSEARARLAEQQALLVKALVARGEPPPHFDRGRLQLAARSLLNKRVREVARAWPALARCLGDQFRERFVAYAEITPSAKGGPALDGLGFARTLPLSELDDAARLELVVVELHRRRLALMVRCLGRRVVLGMRLPWLGVRVVTLRWLLP